MAITFDTLSWSNRHARQVYEELRVKPGVDKGYLRFIDPSFPYSVRMEREIPGAHRHSMIVSDLAASTAYKLGLNADETRVIGILHDGAKLEAPGLFAGSLEGDRGDRKELQTFEEVMIILRHPVRSYEIALRYGIPKEAALRIPEHHGTVETMVKMRPEVMAKFWPQTPHYEFGIPSDQISALIMAADCCGAAADGALRTIGQTNMVPTRAEISTKISRIFGELRLWKQFDENIFPIATQEFVIKHFEEWFVRFYNNMRVFGTPREGDQPIADGRLDMTQPRNILSAGSRHNL